MANLMEEEEELFRFIGHGKFLEECLGQNKPELFRKLVEEYLLPDQRHLMVQEGSFLEKQVEMMANCNENMDNDDEIAIFIAA